MADNQGLHLTTEHESPKSWPDLALKMVEDWAKDGLGVPQDTSFYIVWFAFTLGNWKALVSSTEPDGRYYEVTYHVGRAVAYIDTYKKTHNNVVEVHDG